MTNNHPRGALAVVRDDTTPLTMSVMANLGECPTAGAVNVHMPVWRERVAAWEPWLKAGVSAGTAHLRVYHVLRLGRETTASPDEITADEIVDWIVSYEWSPNTKRSYRASIRAFFTWMHGKGYRSDNPGTILPKAPIPRKFARPAPEAVIDRALAQTAHDAPTVMLAIRLGAQCGLRTHEIAAVHATHVEEHDVGTDRPRYWLRVQGKGGNERVIPLKEDLALAIRERRGWLWPNATDPSVHVKPKWVGTRIARALNNGTDVGRRVTAHALRHRYASRAYANGTDLPSVQKLLGHSKPETTMNYTWIPDENLIEAAKGAW